VEESTTTQTRTHTLQYADTDRAVCGHMSKMRTHTQQFADTGVAVCGAETYVVSENKKGPLSSRLPPVSHVFFYLAFFF
jgi:hypothetical protein